MSDPSSLDSVFGDGLFPMQWMMYAVVVVMMFRKKVFSVASPRRGKLSLKATEESDEREVRAVLAARAFPRSMGLVEMFASTFLHLGFRVLVGSCGENIPQ